MESNSDYPGHAEQAWPRQRSEPRYSVLAVVQLTESVGAFCVQGQLREISRRGCYVKTTDTLPVGTLLKLVVTHDGETFETAGKVIYAHEQVGMGIFFVDPSADQFETLNTWIATLPGAAIS